MTENQIIKSQKEAARYARVTTRTIRRWRDEDGMPVTPEGYYIKVELKKLQRQKAMRISIEKEKIQQLLSELDDAEKTIQSLKEKLGRLVE